MIQKRYFKIIAVVAAFTVIVIIILSNNKSSDNSSNNSSDVSVEAKNNSYWESFFGGVTTFFKSEELDYGKVILDDPHMSGVINTLKERYNHKLSNKGIQVRLLGGLIRYLKSSHPNDWAARIKAIVLAEFPEHSAELIDNLGKLEEYHKFLNDTKDELRGLSLKERREKIQEKRYELFGNDYYEIWKNTIVKEDMSAMLNKLNSKTDMSIHEKMLAYKNFTESLYSEEYNKSLSMTNDDIVARNYALTRKFLSMPSVQADLGAMEPGERRNFLKELRKSMGFNDDVVNKMEEVDTLRDELWKNGSNYDEERKQIMADYEGEELNRKIDAARKKYFGKNATIIKHEEETFNIYKFQFPRRWGMD